MLCSKFELFPTNIFQVMAILKIGQLSQGYSPWFFKKNGFKITPNFYILKHILMSHAI